MPRTCLASCSLLYACALPWLMSQVTAMPRTRSEDLETIYELADTPAAHS
jgi:hypothetical protein